MATSSSFSSISSSSLQCTFLISFSLSLSFSISCARSPLSFSLCLLHLFSLRVPLVSCPYRGILEHSMVHPVLHIMYPTTVFRPLPPLSPFPLFWTRFIPHAHSPVGATLMIYERIINEHTEVSSPGFRRKHDRLPLEDDLFEWQR